MLSYFRLRRAIFTDRGFCVEAPRPLGSVNASFVETDDNGKALRTSRIPGCDGGPDGDDVFIHLRPYRGDPRRAAAAVELCCEHIAAAIAGEEKSRREFGAFAMSLIIAEAKYATASEQIGLLSALFGDGRVLHELNKRGTITGLFELDLAELIAEAYG